MSLIEININNSFNKGENQLQKGEFVADGSTLNTNEQNLNVEVNSMNTVSLTSSAVNGRVTISGGSKRKAVIREIFIAASGTIIGSILTYLILGIK